MRKIEVGMLVRLVLTPENTPLRENLKYNGHVGRVMRCRDTCTKWGPRWDIDGADPDIKHWCNDQLQPIDPPKTTTWEHVAEDTDWNPTKQPTAA